ncbi:Zinc metalloproteinase nas-7 [Folsomia candida]|uniref:Metalloendopeptidase n=1 Tax=Folsomia candida TaxID=158441 RepID=A0A226CVA5_FOLCA|nr:Zinc metalloproteinase nas-7 [Folsomia candida]
MSKILKLCALLAITTHVKAIPIFDYPGGLFEGDILGPIPQVTRAGVINPAKSATFPYQFASTFPSDYQPLFQSAVNHLVGRTCIRLKPRQSEVDFLDVNQLNACSSNIGRIGGGQWLSLANGCNHFGIFVHEIIHAIGFYHEQSRTDRDNYVTINWGNIGTGAEGNFQSYDASQVSPFWGVLRLLEYNALWEQRLHTNNAMVRSATLRFGRNFKIEWSKSIQQRFLRQFVRWLGFRKIFEVKVEKLYLDVKYGVANEGQDILTWDWLNSNNQKWTVDWAAFNDQSLGSKLWTWAQTSGSVKLMDENQANAGVIIWGENGGPNQYWIATQITGSTYTIKNKFSGRCLSNNGADRATCATCDSSNLRQRWQIYTAVP